MSVRKTIVSTSLADGVYRRNRAGFTLIELMAVILVIGILAGIILGMAGHVSRRAAEAQAEAELQKMRTALEGYRQQYGAYPRRESETNERDDWEDLLPGNQSLTNYVPDVKYLDPWGRAYRYRSISPHSFDLYSGGRLGHNVLADNIR